MTDLLLQNGANANAADNKKRTPLHYIAFAPCNSLKYESLTIYDTNLNHPFVYLDDQNITLNSIARLLIKYGANTTATDEDKRTTLHLAIIKGNLQFSQNDKYVNHPINKEITKSISIKLFNNIGKVNLAYYLIGSGTFLDCVDNDNRTPLYYAAESGNV